MHRLFLLLVFKVLFATTSFSAIIILNGLSHKFKVQGGVVYKGVIEVSNTDLTAQAVKLYQTDYTFKSDGSSDYGLPGSLKRSNASWIELGENMFTLVGKEKRVINFQITVPNNDSLFGTYWSVIMVEGLTPPDTTKQKGQFNIKTVTRYGIQVITDIGSEGKRELVFNATKIQNKDSKRLLMADIGNIGDFMLETLFVCELYDAEGKTTKLANTYRKKLYPNTSAMLEIDITSMPIGTYNALLLADCEDDEAFGIQMQLEVKDE